LRRADSFDVARSRRIEVAPGDKVLIRANDKRLGLINGQVLAGIRVVHQEFNQLPYLSVAENLLFEKLPSRFGVLLDRRTLQRRAAELLNKVGLDIDPGERVERLGIAQRQLLEIAKALSSTGRLLVLDEPTATLTSREVARLFELVRAARASGIAVIYVSHHLQEIFDLCDRVTVLRNGRWIKTLPVAATNASELVRLMVGQRLEATTREIEAATNTSSVGFSGSRAPALRIEKLRVRKSTRDVSFALNYGEIVGIAGLVGSGRTEILRAIFGADPREGGDLSKRTSARAITRRWWRHSRSDLGVGRAGVRHGRAPATVWPPVRRKGLAPVSRSRMRKKKGRSALKTIGCSSLIAQYMTALRLC
jgi:ABC-type sugar transport system ATPase subunit